MLWHARSPLGWVNSGLVLRIRGAAKSYWSHVQEGQPLFNHTLPKCIHNYIACIYLLINYHAYRATNIYLICQLLFLDSYIYNLVRKCQKTMKTAHHEPKVTSSDSLFSCSISQKVKDIQFTILHEKQKEKHLGNFGWKRDSNPFCQLID